jgi:hypothetical protein
MSVMINPWVGAKRVAVIPAEVEDGLYMAPTSDWEDAIRRRMLFDRLIPHGTVDRSLRAYIDTVSYGRARLEVDVLNTVVVPPISIDAALQLTPTAHNYEHACVVFTSNRDPNWLSWAWLDAPPYNFRPPRASNMLRSGCRVKMDDPLVERVLPPSSPSESRAPRLRELPQVRRNPPNAPGHLWGLP